MYVAGEISCNKSGRHSQFKHSSKGEDAAGDSEMSSGGGAGCGSMRLWESHRHTFLDRASRLVLIQRPGGARSNPGSAGRERELTRGNCMRAVQHDAGTNKMLSYDFFSLNCTGSNGTSLSLFLSSILSSSIVASAPKMSELYSPCSGRALGSSGRDPGCRSAQPITGHRLSPRR